MVLIYRRYHVLLHVPPYVCHWNHHAPLHMPLLGSPHTSAFWLEPLSIIVVCTKFSLLGYNQLVATHISAFFASCRAGCHAHKHGSSPPSHPLIRFLRLIGQFHAPISFLSLHHSVVRIYLALQLSLLVCWSSSSQDLDRLCLFAFSRST